MAASDNKDNNKPEYNPRWKGYVYIILSSLVALSSISNVPKEVKRSHWATSMAISSITFSVSLLIIIFDRFQCFKMCNFTKAADGKVEGCVLLFFVIIWIVGYVSLICMLLELLYDTLSHVCHSISLQRRHSNSTGGSGLFCHQHLLFLVVGTHFLCLYTQSMVLCQRYH